MVGVLRVAGWWLVVCLLAGCGVLSGGEQRTDWAGLAGQIVAAAGSDQVVRAQLTRSGGVLDMTLRVGGADVLWSVTPDREPRQGGVGSLSFAWEPAAAGEVDWAGLAGLMPAGCQLAEVQVDWLPFGHVYRQGFCSRSDPAVSMWVDDREIHYASGAEDEQAFQAAIDVLTPLFDGGEVVEFNNQLDKGGRGTFTMFGARMVAAADGTMKRFYVTYNGPKSPSHNDALTAGLDDDSRPYMSMLGSEAEVPPFSFRPADIPAASYAKALDEGLAKASFPAEDATMLAFGATTSATEVSYVFYSISHTGFIEGTVHR